MATHVNVLERFAFGRPLEPSVHAPAVQTVPRAGTALIGRVLLSSIFLVSGYAKLTDPAGTISYMQGAGVPSPEVLVYVAGLAELLGGLAVALGFLARVAAVGLIVFLAITTYFFHNFWALEGQEAKMQMVQFMKNLTIAGGLGLMIAYGAGPYSVDAKLARRTLRE